MVYTVSKNYRKLLFQVVFKQKILYSIHVKNWRIKIFLNWNILDATITDFIRHEELIWNFNGIQKFFIDGNLTSGKYLNLGSEEIVLMVVYRINGISFQQDGARTHHGIVVRQFLDGVFPKKKNDSSLSRFETMCQFYMG